MRSIRFRIRSTTRTLLEEIAEKFALDVGFVIDLYALLRLKGNGMPSDDRVKRMVKNIVSRSKGKVSEMTAGVLMRKRVQQLKSVTGTAIFKGLSMRKDGISALKDLLQSLQDFGRKSRQAQCLTCNLLSGCDFGKQYKNATKDITKVFDPDYRKKVDPNCPVLPDIDKANQIAQAAEAFSTVFASVNSALTNAMGNQEQNSAVGGVLDIDSQALQAALQAQEAAEDAPPVDVDGEIDEMEAGPIDDDTPMPAKAFSAWQSPDTLGNHTARFTGNNLILSMAVLQQLDASKLALFELGRKFSHALTVQKKGKFKPVKHVSHSQRSKKMQNLSELTKLESSQHGLPKEIFEQRLNRKALNTREEEERKEQKQLLYLLIDSSGSMQGWFSSRSPAASQRNLFTRCGLAMTLAIAIARHCEKDGGLCFVRFFDQGVSDRIYAHDKASYERLTWEISNCKFDGGGTRIVPALQQVRQDIITAGQTTDLAKSEVILISDNEDRFDAKAAAAAVQGIEFNVLDVSGSEFNMQGASGALKSVANSYMKADEGALDIADLVKLV